MRQDSLFDRDEGEIRAAFLRRLTELTVGLGARKRTAAELGVSEKTLANWLSASPDKNVPVPKLLLILERYRPQGLADFLAGLAGGWFVPAPDGPAARVSADRLEQVDRAWSLARAALIDAALHGDRETARLQLRALIRMLAAIERGLEP